MNAITLMWPASLASLAKDLSERLDGVTLSFDSPGEGGFLFSELIAWESPVRVSLMRYEAQQYTGLDEKGQVAFLIGKSAYCLLSALSALYLEEGVVPSLKPDRVALRLYDVHWEENGESGTYKSLAIHFLDHPCWAFAPRTLVDGAIPVTSQADLQERLRSQLEALYRPFIERLHQQHRLGKAAQWRLVADALAAAFLNVGRELGREAAAREEALQLIRHPGSPLKNKQTDFFDVELHDPKNPGTVLAKQSFRARGGCCRYYPTAAATY